MEVKRVTFEERMYYSLKRKGLAEQFEHAGIYAILLDGKIVYIGKSINILKRMAQHYVGIRLQSEHKYEILAQAAQQGHQIRFRVLCYTENIDTAEGELIRQYKPPLNYQIPKEENWRQYDLNPLARTITLQQLLDMIH